MKTPAFITDMGIWVDLDLSKKRFCHGPIKKYPDGTYGTCKKQLVMAPVTDMDKAWQPFVELTPGVWTNHFNDCVDAELFRKTPAYKEFKEKYNKGPETLPLL